MPMKTDVLVQNVLVHVLQYHSMMTGGRWRCTAVNSETKFALLHRTTGAVGFWVWDRATARFVRITDIWDSLSLIDYAMKYLSIPEVRASLRTNQQNQTEVVLEGASQNEWNVEFFQPHAYTGVLLGLDKYKKAVEERWSGPGILLYVRQAQV
jgi:hypothetical protein